MQVAGYLIGLTDIFPLDGATGIVLCIQGRSLEEINANAEITALHRLFHHEIQHPGSDDVRVESLEYSRFEYTMDLLL